MSVIKHAHISAHKDGEAPKLEIFDGCALSELVAKAEKHHESGAYMVYVSWKHDGYENTLIFDGLGWELEVS